LRSLRGVETLLARNLPEVFGEGDPVRRRAAIRELGMGSGPNGEMPVYTDVDFSIARDGKIAALYVYLDPAQ
jgi:hypothetical protein